jgi:RNA polymerase sigma-70 factor (ECF subfamily)
VHNLANVGDDCPGIQGVTDNLVKRARAGSVVAFEELARRYDRRMLALAWRLTGRLEDAQDVTQEALTRLHGNLRLFLSEEEVAPWLRTVTVNLCRDIARRKLRSPIVASEEWVSRATGESNPEAEVSERQREAILRAALQRLTEKERTALVLRELEGLTTAEVARITGVTEATVRVHILHGRLKLRKLLSGPLGRVGR